MDHPDAALVEALDLARASESRDLTTEDADRLAELLLALHEWFSVGGHLPQAWVLAKTRIVQHSNYLPVAQLPPDVNESLEGGVRP